MMIGEVEVTAKDAIKATALMAAIAAVIVICLVFFPGVFRFLGRHIGVLAVLGGVGFILSSTQSWRYKVPGTEHWVSRKVMGEEGAKTAMFVKGICTIIFGIILILFFDTSAP